MTVQKLVSNVLRDFKIEKKQGYMRRTENASIMINTTENPHEEDEDCENCENCVSGTDESEHEDLGSFNRRSD